LLFELFESYVDARTCERHITLYLRVRFDGNTRKYRITVGKKFLIHTSDKPTLIAGPSPTPFDYKNLRWKEKTLVDVVPKCFVFILITNTFLQNSLRNIKMHSLAFLTLCNSFVVD